MVDSLYKDKIYINSLNMIPGLGAKSLINLIDFFGSAKEVWHANTNDIINSNLINKKTLNNIEIHRMKIDPLVEFDKLKNSHIKTIAFYENEYPKLLRKIYNPPVTLYYKGYINNNKKKIAIVGSRKATKYGRYVSEKISSELAKLGFIIVSGMALGVDKCAHESTINNNGETIAIWGSGLDIVYPPQNRNLANKIIENGAVISEYPIGTKPLSGNFPARNRIISGLSMGTIVVEAPEKSGALITADFALEQGREVFAIPGNINSVYSRGTNNLIKQGAKLVSDIEDILEELNIEPLKRKEMNESNDMEDLEYEEKQILNRISYQGTEFDEIISDQNLPINKINSIITKLEIKGLIRCVSPNNYIRI